MAQTRRKALTQDTRDGLLPAVGAAYDLFDTGDVIGMETFVGTLQFEIYLLAFIEGAITIATDVAVVHEYVFAGVALSNKAIAAGIVKPFDGALFARTHRSLTSVQILNFDDPVADAVPGGMPHLMAGLAHVQQIPGRDTAGRWDIADVNLAGALLPTASPAAAHCHSIDSDAPDDMPIIRSCKAMTLHTFANYSRVHKLGKIPVNTLESRAFKLADRTARAAVV